MASFKILGVSGSARARSFNSALLRAAKEVLPDGVELEIYDVSSFPLYNEDLELSLPEGVARFKEKVKGADAVLIATPEFNFSTSAVLKNALEWGNRPADDNSWDEKPAAILSASSGMRGGARAQLALRQVMLDLNMHPINGQLLVPNASEKFDSDLKLTDARTRERLRSTVADLVTWSKRLAKD